MSFSTLFGKVAHNLLLSYGRYAQVAATHSKEKSNSFPGLSTIPESTLVRFCNRTIEIGLMSLIVFTPLAFGTVQVWSITTMHLNEPED